MCKQPNYSACRLSSKSLSFSKLCDNRCGHSSHYRCGTGACLCGREPVGWSETYLRRPQQPRPWLFPILESVPLCLRTTDCLLRNILPTTFIHAQGASLLCSYCGSRCHPSIWILGPLFLGPIQLALSIHPSRTLLYNSTNTSISTSTPAAIKSNDKLCNVLDVLFNLLPNYDPNQFRLSWSFYWRITPILPHIYLQLLYYKFY